MIQFDFTEQPSGYILPRVRIFGCLNTFALDPAPVTCMETVMRVDCLVNIYKNVIKIYGADLVIIRKTLRSIGLFLCWSEHA